MLIAISTYFRLARYLTARGPVPYFFLLVLLRHRLHVQTECGRVERALGPEGPGKRPAADRLVETDHGGVYIRTPAGQRTAIIGDAFVPDPHDAQKVALGRALAAAHTRTFWACADMRPARHG